MSVRFLWNFMGSYFLQEDLQFRNYEAFQFKDPNRVA